MGQNDDNNNELTSVINNNSQSKIGAKIGVAWVLNCRSSEIPSNEAAITEHL